MGRPRKPVIELKKQITLRLDPIVIEELKKIENYNEFVNTLLYMCFNKNKGDL